MLTTAQALANAEGSCRTRVGPASGSNPQNPRKVINKNCGAYFQKKNKSTMQYTINKLLSI